MIWTSVAVMSIVDVVIMGMIFVSLLALHKDRHTVRRLGLIVSVKVIYFALLLIGLFYLADLLIMHVLPLFTTRAHAMQIMGELHRNWSWVVFLIVVSVITIGLTHLIRWVIPRIVSAITERERAEEELRRARDELEVRVEERTRSLELEIIDRKRAEEVLHRYEHIVSASGDLMAFIDTEYRYRAVNVAYVEAFGKSREELIGQSVAEILGTEVFATRLKPHLDECLSGKRVNFQHWLELPERGRCYLDVHYDPFSDAHGSVTGAVVNIRDVTEARGLSEQLMLLNRQNELLLSSAGEGIYGLDVEGKTTFVNPAAARMIGWEPEELIGKLQHDILHHTKPDGSPYPRQQCPIYAAFKDGTVHYVDNELFWRKDGTSFPVEYISTPIRDQSGLIGAVVSFRDITERKRAEEALKSSEEHFRNLIEGSIQGIYIHRDFEPLFVNQAFVNMLGYDSTDEFLGTIESIVDIHAPHERDRIRGYKEARLRGEGGAPSRYEFEALRKDGTAVILQNFVRVINWEGEPAIQSTVIDVTEARELSQQLSYQASHDALTGLLNRRAFERCLQQLLETAKSEKIEHILCYLDLDQFKVINDSCGHTAGDELLRQLGSVLQQQVRGRDTFARLGGDEFGILLERCSITQAQRVISVMQKGIESFRFAWEDQSFNIGVSIGVVPINEASGNIAGVLRKADAACYAAKDAGRNRVHVYREDDVELAKRQGEMHWVAVINRALEENRFHLAFQSIVPLAKEPLDGVRYELLVRMRDEQDRIVLPDAFLPAAVRYNLSTKVDRWVIRAAFQWLSGQGPHLDRLVLCTINLSGSSLGDQAFLNFVIEQFKQQNLPPEKICFEVTETAAIANLSHATGFIKALKELGCCFALDDFGSGLSSFAYLKNLPVDFIKIDGMFVQHIVDDPVDLAMVKAINDMGHVMGKQTIAEFVENDAILEQLRAIGVDYVQGYGIARPRPLEEMATGPQVEPITPPAGIARRAGRGGRKT